MYKSFWTYQMYTYVGKSVKHCATQVTCPRLLFGGHSPKYGNLTLHAYSHVDSLQVLIFKMFYLLNRKSKHRSVFMVSFVASRSSKLNLILICFDNFSFRSQLPDYSYLVTNYSHVGHQVKIKLLPGFFEFRCSPM